MPVEGRRPARLSRNTARACAKLAAATRKSVLAARASSINASNCGSANRLHHLPTGCCPLKTGDLPASKKLVCDGALGVGETYFGPTAHADKANMLDAIIRLRNIISPPLTGRQLVYSGHA